MRQVIELGGDLLFSLWFGAMALLWMSVLWRRWKPSRTPKPRQAAIEELTAHKLQHQTWVEGQKVAMAWWEQQCACPQVTDYREIPGCKRINRGVCVAWMTDEEVRSEQQFREWWGKQAPMHNPRYRVR